MRPILIQAAPMEFDLSQQAYILVPTSTLSAQQHPPAIACDPMYQQRHQTVYITQSEPQVEYVYMAAPSFGTPPAPQAMYDMNLPQLQPATTATLIAAAPPHLGTTTTTTTTTTAWEPIQIAPFASTYPKQTTPPSPPAPTPPQQQPPSTETALLQPPSYPPTTAQSWMAPPPPRKPPSGGVGQVNVFVSYIPRWFRDRHLLKLCEPYGKVVSVKVVVDPRSYGNAEGEKDCLGYGFVMFENKQDAAKAISKLQHLKTQMAVTDGGVLMSVGPVYAKLAHATATPSKADQRLPK